MDAAKVDAIAVNFWLQLQIFAPSSPPIYVLCCVQVMWLLYEHPEVTFEGISARFMDIRKRVYEVLFSKSFENLPIIYCY